MDYYGEMNESVLSLNIHQKYKNTCGNKYSSDCKAVLVLPQTLTQSITGLECYLNGKKINLKVHEKKKAEKIAQQAEQNGCSTIRSVSSPDEQKTEIILGLLPYNAECDISIQMEITSTNSDSNILQTVIPFSEQQMNQNNFSFSIFFNETIQISKIDIYDNFGQKNSDFEFDGKRLKLTKKPDGPIVMITELCDKIPSIIINDVNDEYSAIQINPQFSNDFVNSDFIFIVDCSGSMAGSAMRNAKECLSTFLHSIPVGCNFSIIMFGTYYRTVFGENQLVEYNGYNLQIAESAIQQMDANMGGTNLHGPLMCAYKQSQNTRKKGKIVQMFILTDGMIHDKENVFKLVRKNRSNNRIFSLGIGNEVDKDLVSGLAVLSFGKFDFINESSMITENVINLLSLSLAPALTNVSIRSPDDELLEIIPNPLTPIYDGSMTMVYVKRKSNVQSVENILITGNIGDEQVEWLINKQIHNTKGISKKLFASNAINDYENICDDMPNNSSDFKKYKNKIIELSIENAILSKFTSFVGVEEYPHTKIKQNEPKLNSFSNGYIPSPFVQNIEPTYGNSYCFNNMQYQQQQQFQQYQQQQMSPQMNFSGNYFVPHLEPNYNTNYLHDDRTQLFEIENDDSDFDQSNFSSDELNEYYPPPPSCGFAPPPSYGLPPPDPFMFQKEGPQPRKDLLMKRFNKSFSSSSKKKSKCSKPSLKSMEKRSNQNVFNSTSNTNSNMNFDYSLIGIIRSQDFDGKWSNSLLGNMENFLNSSCKINISQINQFLTKNAKGLDSLTEVDMKCTIMALCILNKLYSQEQNKWRLIQMKALNWLKSKLNVKWEVEIANLSN